ncbi:acyl-CoA dehydrogenase family protein [Gordonia liuliyuniae]|uniref:Acyl-CoA dehydrogenase family protein n=1 Tax=Gordonia liuliyuniae TaxID=2911517 RepID=A0ABS9IWB0_9ACTN|nr:acyl-CoA dehydrogenase family protein [Gordonia liuliyuniae]MCF8589860.1 acyl-CoA dehydrogenase family protein [Gordonia liuliyuniae]
MKSENERVASAAQAVLEEFPPDQVGITAFYGACFDAGLSWVHFPAGLGGLGHSRGAQQAADEVFREAGVRSPFFENPIGYGMGAPTVCEHAAPELAARLLRPLATCEDIWCQLFSEPSAGSDLASLATSAVRNGDRWIVNGQKVWTSYAHRARWAMLLARTDPAAPKHQGLTYFVVDMHHPGVQVRPLRQMTGEAEFNEVYLTDVVIPDTHRLGEVGNGWRVAMTTLMNERSSIGAAVVTGAEIALDLWQSRPESHTPVLRDRLVELWIADQSHRLTTARAQVGGASSSPGPEGSIAKLFGAEFNQDVFDFCMDLLGPEATLYDSYDLAPAANGHSIQRQFLRSRANTIEGGTSDVLRNILAERILGLPKEPRTDDTLPWKDIPRG